MNKYIGYAVVFAVLILSLVTAGVKTSYATNTVVTDDFSTDSGLWTLLGTKKPAIINKTMRLTSSEPSQVGTIWLNQTIAPPYTVTFRFLIDEVDPFGIGADGIVFMFNKYKNTAAVAGGGMGFEIGNGYGVEFDTYYNANGNDPRSDHISLFKDNPDHRLGPVIDQVNDTTFENGKWHSVKIIVDTNNVKVYLDGNPKINKDVTLDLKYSGIGFAASTGAYFNKQSIGDVVITKPAAVTKVNSTVASGYYPAGKDIPIELTFNDTIQVTGAPILALNTNPRHNATYTKGSGTNKLTFNYTVQPGDNLSNLNYASDTALSLNGGALLDSLGYAVNLSLADAVNSLGSKGITLDTTLPTVTASITSGDPSTKIVNLSLTGTESGSGLSDMHFSNDNITWYDWEPYAGSKAYSAPDNTKKKTIYAQVRDKANNSSVAFPIPINPPSVIVPAAPLTTKEDTLFNGELSITNPDNRTLELIKTSSPSKGIVTSLATSTVSGVTKVTFNYMPNVNVNGTDSFSFMLSDGVSYSNTAKVDLSIGAVNDPPVAIDRTLTVVEDVPILFSVSAADVDSTNLTFSKGTDGIKGTVALSSSSGDFIYTPKPNANGSDSFEFIVSDGGTVTSTGTVYVTILPVNDAPVVSDLTIITSEDKKATGKLIGFDVEGDPLTYQLVANGSQGNVTIDADGSYTYTPNANVNGTGADTFKFIAKDSSFSSNIATVTVDITPVNDAPSFIKGLDQKVTSDSVTHNVYGWATAISKGPANESGQTVNFFVTNDQNAFFDVQPSVSSDGVLSFTPNANASGTVSVTVSLQDNGGTLYGGSDTSAQQHFSITISAVTLTITGITVSPPDVWTNGPLTVSASVYSNTDEVIVKKWGFDNAAELTKQQMEDTRGTLFDGSFSVGANGVYTIYAYTSFGSFYDIKHINITQIDKELPVIQLHGDASLIIEAGTPFLDPGADVSDNSLADSLEHPVIISAADSDLMTNVVGHYTLTYRYTDQAGNPALPVTRNVEVKDTTKPVITLLGANPLIVAQNIVLDPKALKATVTDNSLEPLTATPVGVLNLAVPGRYDLVYSATDSHNNTASVTRTVYVLDTLAPTISNISINPDSWTKGSVTVSAEFNGTGSDVISKQWAEGAQSLNYFTDAANALLLHTIGNNSFDVLKNNNYTIYAEDKYGNTAISVVDVHTIDKTAPIGGILINNGETSTYSTQVTLQLNASDIPSDSIKMQLSNDSSFSNTTVWINYTNTVDWTLSSGDGPKTVYVKFIDAAGNESDVSAAAIYLDSGNADLSQLTIADQTLSLSPSFDPAITYYAVTVASTVDTIDLLPKLVNTSNTLSVIRGGEYISEGQIVRSPLTNTGNGGNNLITIRVTTVNTAVYQDYTINVYKLSPRNSIMDFSVDGQATAPVIDAIKHTISLNVNSQTSLNGLIPHITLSRGATIGFADGSTNDFRKQVHYVVTAEDGKSVAEWTVNIDSLIPASADLSNLSLDGFPFAFNPAATDFSVEVGPLVEQVLLTALPADPSAKIAITGVTYDVETHTIVLANGNNPIHIVVTTDNGLSKSYDLNVKRLPTFISSLSITGGSLSADFNPNQTTYVIQTSKTTHTIGLTVPTLASNVKLTIEGASYIADGSVYNINLDDVAAFDIKVTSLDGVIVHEHYHFNLNPWLAYASSNADGTEAIIVFKEPINLTKLSAANFSLTIGDSNATVTSVSSDQGDSNHPIVHLKLSGAKPGSNNWLLNITGVETTAKTVVNVQDFPMTTPTKVQQLKTLIDLSNDGVHMDDIIMYMQTKQDVTGDGVFDRFDIQYLLDQI